VNISYQVLLTIEFVLKLLISSLCGSVLILSSEKPKQSRYSYIFVMISLGSCLLVILWDINFGDAVGLSMMFFSSMIVSLGIISSAIIITHHGSLDGLIIAATIWVAGGIGIAVGYSLYFSAIITTFIAYVFLRLLVQKKDIC
jgi:putative Mg2+ transporter-C (MgtC) family protein